MFIKADKSNVSGYLRQGEFTGVVVAHEFGEINAVSAKRVIAEGQGLDSANPVVTRSEIAGVDRAMDAFMRRAVVVCRIAEQMVANEILAQAPALDISAKIVEQPEYEHSEEDDVVQTDYARTGSVTISTTPRPLRAFDNGSLVSSGYMNEAMAKLATLKKGTLPTITRENSVQGSQASAISMPAKTPSVMKLGELRPKARPTSASSRRSDSSDTASEILVAGRQIRSVTYTAGETKEGGDVELVKYIGEVDENGMRHGIGTLWFRDGSMYEGEFENDWPHGVGIET